MNKEHKNWEKWKEYNQHQFSTEWTHVEDYSFREPRYSLENETSYSRNKYLPNKDGIIPGVLG
jgi:hypothetical protein